MKEQSTEDNQNGNVPVSLGNMEEEVVNNKSSSNKVNRRNQSLEGNISWLLRLFRSDFFDVSLAVAYLWQYPDPGVKDYLVNELFNMPFSKLNFYIPQLPHVLLMALARRRSRAVSSVFLLAPLQFRLFGNLLFRVAVG
jgi:hypothetical protein